MSGPPGGGKTTVRELAVPDLEHRRVIDSDVVKRYLAQWCVEHGVYVELVAEPLPDGRTVQPMGLAPLLQTVSTDATNAVRRIAFADGEDVVIEATLASSSYGERLLLSLAKANYTDLLVVSAETDYETARERVRSRWWSERDSDPLGGRLVRPEAIDFIYVNDVGVSVCRANAMALVRTVRSGQTALDRASLVAYDDGVLAFADNEPPRLVK
jgi:predicted kinase